MPQKSCLASAFSKVKLNRRRHDSQSRARAHADRSSKILWKCLKLETWRVKKIQKCVQRDFQWLFRAIIMSLPEYTLQNKTGILEIKQIVDPSPDVKTNLAESGQNFVKTPRRNSTSTFELQHFDRTCGVWTMNFLSEVFLTVFRWF